MPIYEYECGKCGERFEFRRSISDSDSEIRCPECETENLRRVFSVFTAGSSSGACAPSSPT
ncbi:zinc ribbon domain-containing protein [Chloroflexota bacterium]